MKTKGALLWGVNEKWSIEEIELGDPVAGEVQIRMEAAGMCHSDHHIVTGATPMPSYPAMGGHEGSGVITKVGEGVTGVEVGDHVVLSFIPACGRCPSCSEGHRTCAIWAWGCSAARPSPTAPTASRHAGRT